MQFKYKRKQRTVERRLKWTVQKASMEILLADAPFQYSTFTNVEEHINYDIY
jgi:hypothetical protein